MILIPSMELVQPRKALWFKGTFRAVTAIDPAVSKKKRSCYTAIVTVGWDISIETPTLYVLDARQGHWKPTPVLDQAYSAYVTYEPQEVLMESTAFQEVFIDLWREMASNRDCTMPLRGIEADRYGKDKTMRLAKTAKFYQQNRVAFDGRSATQQKLIEQIITYTDGNICDLMDACCIAVNHLATRHKPMRKGQNTDEFEPVRVQGRVVGYKKRVST